MTNVFVGGSRRVSRLTSDVKQRLDRMMAGDMRVLVGDANGADKAIQMYLMEHEYQNVVVFCTGTDCRNNVGLWQVRTVTPPHRTRDFEYFTAKDAAMAEAADAALMLWDGESTGTVVNVARLIARGKPTVVFVAPMERFQTIKTRRDLNQLLLACPIEARQRIDAYISQHAEEYAQVGIF